MQIFWNGDDEDHGHVVRGLFKGAKHFDCAVAFATTSGFGEISDELHARLKKGMSARFFVRLDFYQTQPDLLDALLKLKRTHDVEAFVRRASPGEVFHPKIFRFEYDQEVALVVGSANWTKGGLSNNFECSSLTRAPKERVVKDLLDQLVKDEVVDRLTSTIAADYRRRYAIARVVKATAEKKIDRLCREEQGGEEALALVLRELRADRSKTGFAALVKARSGRRKQAVAAIQAIVAAAPRSAVKMRPMLVTLRNGFDAGGLQRAWLVPV